VASCAIFGAVTLSHCATPLIINLKEPLPLFFRGRSSLFRVSRFRALSAGFAPGPNKHRRFISGRQSFNEAALPLQTGELVNIENWGLCYGFKGNDGQSEPDTFPP